MSGRGKVVLASCLLGGIAILACGEAAMDGVSTASAAGAQGEAPRFEVDPL